MESMYDRLGDLLKETLEAGSVRFVKIKKSESNQKIEAESEKPEEEKLSDGFQDFKVKNNFQPKTKKTSPDATIFHRGENNGFSQSEYEPKIFYKKITPQIEHAYSVLDIPADSGADEIKKAYKDKLKYFHPDRYEENLTLQKIATNKTREIVEAYKLICDFLEI